jgi:hypothetical protein
MQSQTRFGLHIAMRMAAVGLFLLATILAQPCKAGLRGSGKNGCPPAQVCSVMCTALSILRNPLSYYLFGTESYSWMGYKMNCMAGCKFLSHLNPFEKNGAGTQHSLAQEVARDLRGESLPNVVFADPVQRRQNFCHTYCASVTIAELPLMYCDWATQSKITKWHPYYFMCLYPCKAAGSVKNFLMGKYYGDGKPQQMGTVRAGSLREFIPGAARSQYDVPLDSLDGDAATSSRPTFGQSLGKQRQSSRNPGQTRYAAGPLRAPNDPSLDGLDTYNTQRQGQPRNGVQSPQNRSWD